MGIGTIRKRDMAKPKKYGVRLRYSYKMYFYNLEQCITRNNYTSNRGNSKMTWTIRNLTSDSNSLTSNLRCKLVSIILKDQLTKIVIKLSC